MLRCKNSGEMKKLRKIHIFKLLADSLIGAMDINSTWKQNEKYLLTRLKKKQTAMKSKLALSVLNHFLV